MTKETKTKPELSAKYKEIYKDEKDGEYAKELISQINEDLELREKSSMVSNGIPYSSAYEYNQRKAVNYAPPRSTSDDREVSMGMVHEKIVAFSSMFLKYVFKREIKCYDENGNLIKDMGDIYDMAIEFSHKLEKLQKKMGLIYWEVFTQGNAFLLEDWEVKIKQNPKAFIKGENGEEKKPVTPDTMDYTYEFLDGLTYEDGKVTQERKAVTVLLDGRQIIFGNPETEDIQEQPRITIEEEITKADAEALFGTLKRWKSVPKNREEITDLIGEKVTLFSSARHKKPEDIYIVHRTLDVENNRLNIFVNGVMMLPRKTALTLFYPRGNYPISNIPAERLRGSIYARSIPAKTKFNADFVDWALKMLANKFEQGVDPAIITNGKYTLTRDMFRGGQVTHGVKTGDYAKADPDNKGVTNAEFSFTNLLKDIIESQTLNPTSSGELSSNNTAFEIAKVDQAQIEKLGFMLDGLVNGFMDMALRRAETIESKYTIKQKETLIDGKKVSVFQNFTVNIAGTENVVDFDEEVGTPTFDVEGKGNEIFTKEFQAKKSGYPTKYFLVNPNALRDKKYILDITIKPEKVKDSQLQMIQMWDEFTQLINTFGLESQGGSVSMEELKKEYLKVSGKPDKIFTTDVYKRLDREIQNEEGEAYNKGSFAKPTIKSAQQQDAGLVK